MKTFISPSAPSRFGQQTTKLLPLFISGSQNVELGVSLGDVAATEITAIVPICQRRPNGPFHRNPASTVNIDSHVEFWASGAISEV